ncbi:hypothetical protein [Corallococcus sp. EGB]|uniref:hypothetical protein n=1 Tax=Corallococcus sp. EGB TaxID=1521117 RepID=UPI001CBDDCA4|nr:hypothetical protein [Corallococcus sp. EGB]
MKFTSKDVSKLLDEVSGSEDLIGYACATSYLNGQHYTWNGTQWVGTYFPELKYPVGEDSSSSC